MATLLPQHLLPSKAGARGQDWDPRARRLTVRSLSVPPRWFSMQVYTVEPAMGEKPDVFWPQSLPALKQVTIQNVDNPLAGHPWVTRPVQQFHFN